MFTPEELAILADAYEIEQFKFDNIAPEQIGDNLFIYETFYNLAAWTYLRVPRYPLRIMLFKELLKTRTQHLICMDNSPT